MPRQSIKLAFGSQLAASQALHFPAHALTVRVVVVDGGGQRRDGFGSGSSRYPPTPHQQFAVVGGIAKESFRTLGALVPKVGIVVPGEADPAVNLDAVACGTHVRGRGGCLGETGERGQILVVASRGVGSLVGRGLGQLDLEQEVGAAVFDGLEGADGTAELHAHVGVCDR